MVEAVGIEPTSEDKPDKASTCIAGDLISPDGCYTDKATARPAGLNLAPYNSGACGSQPVFATPAAAPQAGIMRQTGCLLVRQPEPSRSWHLMLVPFDNEVRVPGMQPYPANYPRRNQIAPLFDVRLKLPFAVDNVKPEA